MYGNATGPLTMTAGLDAVPCAYNWTWSDSNDADAVCSYDEFRNQLPEPDTFPRLPHKYDVLCKNGGQRHWHTGDNGPEVFFGQSYCDCPPGWGGADCSQCITVRGDGHVCVHQVSRAPIFPWV